MRIERIPAPFASLYEKASRLARETYYRQVAQEVVAFLREGAILDLGTGPGYLPIEIAKKSESIRVVGIDLSRRLIEMARDHAARAGLSDRLHFEIGNASRLRFTEESFDMILSTGMLHSLRDPVKVFTECYRVLKPGGEVWIFDPAKISSEIDVRENWTSSLTFLEKSAYLFFRFYSRINPGRVYERKEISSMIAKTPFKTHWISELNGELRMRLRK